MMNFTTIKLGDLVNRTIKLNIFYC